MKTCGEIRRRDELRVVVAARWASPAPAESRSRQSLAGSSFASSCRRVHAAPPSPCRRAPPSSVGHGLARAVLERARRESTAARVDRGVALRQPYASRSASRAAGRLQLADDCAAAAARTAKSGSFSCVSATLPASGALKLRERGEHRRNHALVLVAGASRARARARPPAATCRARAASAARTLQCGIGVHARQHERRSCRGRSPRRRGARRRASPATGSVSRSCTIGKPRRPSALPSAVTLRAGRSDRSRRRRASFDERRRRAPDRRSRAERPDRRRPSPRAASRACSTSAISGATAAGSLITPRPRAANARVYLPGPSSSFSSAGSRPRVFDRPSAYATGHQVVTRWPPRRARRRRAARRRAAARARTRRGGTPPPPARAGHVSSSGCSRANGGRTSVLGAHASIASAAAARRLRRPGGSPISPSASAARPRTSGDASASAVVERRGGRCIPDQAERECGHLANLRIGIRERTGERLHTLRQPDAPDRHRGSPADARLRVGDEGCEIRRDGGGGAG